MNPSEEGENMKQHQKTTIFVAFIGAKITTIIIMYVCFSHCLSHEKGLTLPW